MIKLTLRKFWEKILKATEIEKNLNNLVGSVYIINGNDGYLKNMATSSFKKLVSNEFSDFNIKKIDLALGVENLSDCLNTLPMFDDKKVVFVKDPKDKLKADIENFLLEYCKNTNDDTVLVLFDGDNNLKFLHEYAEIVNCNKLGDKDITVEIEKILSHKFNLAMDFEAQKLLATYCQNDMTRISNEISKLASFADKTITEQDIKELVVPDVEIRIFELSSALSDKQNAKALMVLDSFLKDNVSPMTVFSLLINQYRRLLHTSLLKNSNNNEIASFLEIKPGAVYILRNISKKYTQLKLKKIVELLEEMQYSIVRDSADGEYMLKNAVATLMVL